MLSVDRQAGVSRPQSWLGLCTQQCSSSGHRDRDGFPLEVPWLTLRLQSQTAHIKIPVLLLFSCVTWTLYLTALSLSFLTYEIELV